MRSDPRPPGLVAMATRGLSEGCGGAGGRPEAARGWGGARGSASGPGGAAAGSESGRAGRLTRAALEVVGIACSLPEEAAD